MTRPLKSLKERARSPADNRCLIASGKALTTRPTKKVSLSRTSCGVSISRVWWYLRKNSPTPSPCRGFMFVIWLIKATEFNLSNSLVKNSLSLARVHCPSGSICCTDHRACPASCPRAMSALS